jgi:hypothetical protein
MIRLCACFCIAGLAIAIPRAVLAQTDSSSPPKAAHLEYLTATNTYVRFLEERVEMKTKLREKRVGCEDEVDFYRFQLAIMRYNLAVCQDKPDEAREQFRMAVTVREAQHSRVKRLQERGGGFDEEIQVAERQLASSRYRLACVGRDFDEGMRQLKRIEAIASQELERERGLLGRNASTPSEVEDATFRLANARYLQALMERRGDDCMQLLRDMCALTESAVARMRRLESTGAASADETDWARFRDLTIQQRVVRATGQMQKFQDLQEQLARVAARMLGRALRAARESEEEKEYLKWQEVVQRYLLVRARQGVPMEFDYIWDLDGWTHIPHQRRG